MHLLHSYSPRTCLDFNLLPRVKLNYKNVRVFWDGMAVPVMSILINGVDVTIVARHHIKTDNFPFFHNTTYNCIHWMVQFWKEIEIQTGQRSKWRDSLSFLAAFFPFVTSIFDLCFYDVRLVYLLLVYFDRFTWDQSIPLLADGIVEKHFDIKETNSTSSVSAINKIDVCQMVGLKYEIDMQAIRFRVFNYWNILWFFSLNRLWHRFIGLLFILFAIVPTASVFGFVWIRVFHCSSLLVAFGNSVQIISDKKSDIVAVCTFTLAATAIAIAKLRQTISRNTVVRSSVFFSRYSVARSMPNTQRISLNEIWNAQNRIRAHAWEKTTAAKTNQE